VYFATVLNMCSKFFTDFYVGAVVVLGFKLSALCLVGRCSNV
jgi:hypothetical protein